MNTETKHTPNSMVVYQQDDNGQFEVYESLRGRIIFKSAGGGTEANVIRLCNSWNAHDDMAKEIAQLKQQNEELKAHEQEIRDCWTEERTDHNKAREEIAQLRAIAEGVIVALSYPRGSEAQVRCLEEVGDDARNLISKHTKV